MTADITSWDAAYEQQPYWTREPDEEVIPLHDTFRSNGVEQILDLGCGDGRHLVYFARLRYAMYGLDCAIWGVRRAREWLLQESLHAELVCGDMVQLPWPDERFDAVLSTRVVHHNRLTDIRRTLDEVYRVLREGGLFFATIARYRPDRLEDWKDGNYREVEPHTYIPTEGLEKDLPHHLFTGEELRETLHRFDLISFDSGDRYHNVLTQKPR